MFFCKFAAYFENTFSEEHLWTTASDDTLKKLCAENNCDVVIVPHNLTNKFQPLDLSVNKAAKLFIQNKYNDWLPDQVFTRSLKMEKILPMLKYHPNYRICNPYMRDGLLIGIIMW